MTKKSKKGATITGKKEGKAKISVAMKYGKKTLKKTITVSVTKKAADTNNTTKPSATPTATPTPAATPTAKPTDSPSAEPMPTPGDKPDDSSIKLDLSTYTVPEGAEDAVSYDAATGTLNIVDTSLFRVPLPEKLPMGSELSVKVTGTLKGELGFRSYMIADNQDTAMSTIANSDEDGVSIGEPFEWEYTLTNNTGAADSIQFKGILFCHMALRFREKTY